MMPAAVEREKVVQFKKENAATLELKTFAPVDRFLKLRKIGFDNVDAAQIVATHNKGELSVFHDRLVFNTQAFLMDKAPELLTAKEQAQARHYTKLYAALDPVQGVKLTSDELAEIMQPLCGGKLSTNKAVTLAKRLYEVAEHIERKCTTTTRKYELIERTNLEKVLQPYRMSVSDFLLKNSIKPQKTDTRKTAKTLIINDVTELLYKENNFVTLFADVYTEWWSSSTAVWNQ